MIEHPRLACAKQGKPGALYPLHCLEQNTPTMAASHKSPPTPKEAVHALKYWLPALAAIVAAGGAGGIYVSSKADRAELKEITEKVSWVKETLVKLSTQIEESEKRRERDVAGIVRDELAKVRNESTGGKPARASVKRASFSPPREE